MCGLPRLLNRHEEGYMILLASGNFMSSMVELITVLCIFVFVLMLTYFVTRWIAGYQRTKTAQGNLSVIEAIRVSNNQSIQLLRAGTDKYLVIGVGKEEITLLATLSKEELRELPAGGISAKTGESFSDLLEAVKKKLPRK